MKDQILRDLSPLIKRAQEENLMIRCRFDNHLCFTPDEFQKYHKEGRFIWGLINWELVGISNLKKVKRLRRLIRLGGIE